MTLAEFLLARIAEDEAAINSAGHHFVEIQEYMLREMRPNSPIVYTEARMLAECEAKRRIVEAHPLTEHMCPGKPVEWIGIKNTVEYGAEEYSTWVCHTLAALAMPYAAHPDYDPAWAPAD